MDRDGFVEFVQRTFAERKTKGSKVPFARCQSAKITAYLHVGMRLHNPCTWLVYINQLASATHETCSLSLDWTCEAATDASEPGNQMFAQRNLWIVREFVLLDMRDPWITRVIHELSRKVRIHSLRSAIRGLRKSILCAQHI